MLKLLGPFFSIKFSKLVQQQEKQRVGSDRDSPVGALLMRPPLRQEGSRRPTVMTGFLAVTHAVRATRHPPPWRSPFALHHLDLCPAQSRTKGGREEIRGAR